MAASAILFAAGLLYHGVTGALMLPSTAGGTGGWTAPAQLELALADATHTQPIQPLSVPIIHQDEDATGRHYQPTKLHGRFLHITDFHPDDFYKIHTSTAQDHACHSGKGPAGTYGAETTDCDAPISLVNATFDWIEANLRHDIDFVVWTGDSARHDSDESIPRSPAQVLGTNRMLATKFAETFTDAEAGAVPVVPNFGNNDILPHNILLPGPNKWFSYYADIWKKFIPEEQRHSFEFGGWFYVEVIPNKLAVFSLNTLYLFDRNAAVDDCVKPSEPGYKHLEWLRIQLQFMRDRGMKAILMGHVPPARTDSKMLWDETCWQKYTLWLKQFRDVVVGGLYGHMNIDHFLIADTKDITIDSTAVSSQGSVSTRQYLDDELSLQSATDYLEELRDAWAKLPKVQIESVDADSTKKDKNGKKGKKGKKDKGKRLGGKWAERYQLSFVSPSIVPNYFPTLRVYEYNITGLEDAVTWAEYEAPLPIFDMPRTNELDPDDLDWLSELELRGLSDLDEGDWGVDHDNTNDIEADKKKKKKGKKPKKDKSKDPNLHIPDPPAKTAPPGPAYSLQPLTLLGYKQYFANLTHINNLDVATVKDSDDDSWLSWVWPTRWREGKHGQETPKSKKPKPRKFKFEIEYTTYDDKLYGLKDLTVRSFVDLAYRMGQSAKGKMAQVVLPAGERGDDLENEEDEEQNSEVGESRSETDDDLEELDSDDDDLEAEGKKHKDDKKKKKKKKKKQKKLNKTWLHFLKHAFVSTVEEDELREKFS